MKEDEGEAREDKTVKKKKKERERMREEVTHEGRRSYHKGQDSPDLT